MLTLIGSRAAKLWFPEFREPKDSDWHSPEVIDGVTGDYFVDSRLAQWDWSAVATPDELYTIKVSHSFWEIGASWEKERRWNKHMADIIFFQRKGVQFQRKLGEYCYLILKVADQYFRKEGAYSSYHGTDWDGEFDEVEPYTKTVTDYRVKS